MLSELVNGIISSPVNAINIANGYSRVSCYNKLFSLKKPSVGDYTVTRVAAMQEVLVAPVQGLLYVELKGFNY